MEPERPIRLVQRAHEVRECDLDRVRLDQLAVSREPPVDQESTLAWVDPELIFPRVRIGFTATWTERVVGFRPGQVCPGCGNHRLRPHEVCVVCHQTRSAPRQHPQIAPSVRKRILAGPPLRARVQQALTRRQRRQQAHA